MSLIHVKDSPLFYYQIVFKTKTFHLHLRPEILALMPIPIPTQIVAWKSILFKPIWVYRKKKKQQLYLYTTVMLKITKVSPSYYDGMDLREQNA